MPTERRPERHAPGSARLGPLPFVDRDAELAMLRDMLHAAREVSRSLAFISGESGVGKTRLLEQIASDVVASDWTHATGTPYEVESGSPYAVISDALAASARALMRAH